MAEMSFPRAVARYGMTDHKCNAREGMGIIDVIAVI